MAVDQIEQVVDKLAEKIGVAAERLMPLGEELLAQIQARGSAQMIIAGSVAAFVLVVNVGILLLAYYGRQAEKAEATKNKETYDGDEMWFGGSIAVTISSAIIILSMAIVFAKGLMAYIAPLAKVLGI